MADRSTNTMVEGLQKLFKDVGQLKLTSDADMPFIIQLETTIMDKLKQPVQQMTQQGDLPPDPQGGDPMGGQGMPMPPQGMPMQAGGLMQGGAPPNPDELRRILGGGQ